MANIANPPRALLPGLALACATALAAGPAHAAPICVSCTDPDQSYACTVEGASVRPGSQSMQLYCIVRLAKEGGHRACTVARGTTPCDGLARAYVYDGPSVPSAVERAAVRAFTPVPETGSDAGGANAPETAAIPDEPAPEPAPSRREPPKTLVEMGSRAAQSTGGTVRNVTQKTGQGVSNAARGVGRGARNTFTCVFSLFRQCGPSEP